MGLKSPVRAPPCARREDTGRTSRRQLREGDRPWNGSRRARRRAYAPKQPRRPTGRVRWHNPPQPQGQARGSMRRWGSGRARASLGRPPDPAPRGRGAARRATGVLRVEASAEGIVPPRPRREGLNRSGALRPPTRDPRHRPRTGESRGRRRRRGRMAEPRPIAWSRASPGNTCGERGTGCRPPTGREGWRGGPSPPFPSVPVNTGSGPAQPWTRAPIARQPCGGC